MKLSARRIQGWLRWVPGAFFLLIILVQANASWNSLIRPTAQKVLRAIDRPAWQRTAVLLVGDDRADYFQFLREIVPEDGKVILPPHSLGIFYEHIGFMQYMLFPRDIDNCGPDEEECIRRNTGDKTFILALTYFPPREIADELKRFISFKEEWGVYAPQ